MFENPRNKGSYTIKPAQFIDCINDMQPRELQILGYIFKQFGSYLVNKSKQRTLKYLTHSKSLRQQEIVINTVLNRVKVGMQPYKAVNYALKLHKAHNIKPSYILSEVNQRLKFAFEKQLIQRNNEIVKTIKKGLTLKTVARCYGLSTSQTQRIKSRNSIKGLNR